MLLITFSDAKEDTMVFPFSPAAMRYTHVFCDIKKKKKGNLINSAINQTIITKRKNDRSKSTEHTLNTVVAHYPIIPFRAVSTIILVPLPPTHCNKTKERTH